MGHDLASGLTAVSLAACRNARRTGADLPELVQCVDDALAQWLPDQFRRGVLAQLDLASGVLRWTNCGRPAPLVIHDRRLLGDAMLREPDPPMGLPSLLADRRRPVHEIALKPGEPASATLRRLIHSILDSSTRRLRDDATILMLAWSPPSR
jgi:hypothetical protein